MSTIDLREQAGIDVVVGRLDDLAAGEGRAYAVRGTQIAVFRLRDGTLHATHAVCPHQGGPLADGQTDSQVVVCPLHLNAYRWSDGGSTTGAPSLRVFRVCEVDGDLVVTVPERMC